LFQPSASPLLSRRRFAQWLGAAASPLAAASLYTPVAQAAGLVSLLKDKTMNTPQTAVFKWDVDFCKYGIDIDPRAGARVSTLSSDNILWDADGLEVARFYSGMGAAWGLGSRPMGGPNPNGAKLPQRLLFTYYDYLEDRFYQLKTELPLQKLFDLFSQIGLARDNLKARPKYQTLRIGVAPRGNIMMWAAGYTDNQVELGTYRAEVLEGMTPKIYNAGGVRAFPLREDRWEELSGGRAKPATIERIKAGWVPDPAYYMRRIRVKYPWRFKLTGEVSRVTDMLSFESSAESTAYGAWEMGLYQLTNVMRAPPTTAFFWFHDLAGKRHYLWLEFWRKERAVSEADMTEMFAAFEQVLGKRTVEDNLFAPNDADMATVEVHVGEDFQTITASLVKGTVRVPLPVGRTQHFSLEPYAYWNGNPTPSAEVIRLFQEGPPAKVL
jgi:hypothetical protein